MKNSRRQFFKKTGTGFLALGAPFSFVTSDLSGMRSAAPVKKEDLFKIGMAGYTFIKFKVEPALEMMSRVGVQYLCIKDFHLPYNSTDAQISEFHNKLKAKGITGHAVGPSNMRSEAQADQVFEYAKRVGVNKIIGVPSHALLPYIDKKVKEYDFVYAIHNHGPGDKLYPSIESIYEKVKSLDSRIGICHDIGYTRMLGFDPAAETFKYAARIFDVHLRDVTAASEDGTDCELGRGVIDFQSYVKALRKTKYTGMCNIEYERVLEDPQAGIAESMGYIKGVMDSV